MKTQSTVIQTINLTKDYELGSFSRNKLRALDHLELVVEEGETFGLIGPNRAGKTTTLKLLMGLVFLYAIRVAGKSSSTPDSWKRFPSIRPGRPTF